MELPLDPFSLWVYILLEEIPAFCTVLQRDLWDYIFGCRVPLVEVGDLSRAIKLSRLIYIRPYVLEYNSRHPYS